MDKKRTLIALSDLTKLGEEDFAALSTPRKVFSAIRELEAEVNNGGFSQYFFNDSRKTAGFVIEALNTIGAPATADICRRAIVVAFPSGLPLDPEAIHEAAAFFSEAIDDALNALDAEYYRYPDDLTELLFAYVSKHPEEFGRLPDDV